MWNHQWLKVIKCKKEASSFVSCPVHSCKKQHVLSGQQCLQLVGYFKDTLFFCHSFTQDIWFPWLDKNKNRKDPLTSDCLSCVIFLAEAFPSPPIPVMLDGRRTSMTKSIRLSVWQGDPVGQEKIPRLGERIWPAPVLWQISLKMGVRLQYITMLDSGLVSQNDSTHLFHYLLEKMTLCPGVSGSYSEIRPRSATQKEWIWNNACLIF